jgi:hypothetical protein
MELLSRGGPHAASAVSTFVVSEGMIAGEVRDQSFELGKIELSTEHSDKDLIQSLGTNPWPTFYG